MNDKLNRILLIVNPSSGRGKSIDMLPEVDSLFSKIGVKTDIRITENSEQATDIAFAASHCGCRRVVAMGGDGTVNMVASGLLGSDSVLAVIPTGTGNDFFKLLRTKGDLETVCRTAAFGETIDLDVGLFNDRPFFNMLGIGFDAEVADEANKSSNNLGLLTYMLAVYRVWKRFPAYKIRLRIDNFEFDDQVMLVAVGIGQSTGGGFLLTPHAVADDGKFDICIVHKTSRRRIFSILPRVIKGAHIRQPETSMYRCRQLEITSKQPLPIHYEGETMINNNGRLLVKMSVNKLKVASGVKNTR